MRLTAFLEFINESPYRFPRSPRTGKKFQTYSNPERQEWQKLNGEARGYLIGNDLIVWGITDGIHKEVARELGISPDAIPVYVYVGGDEIYLRVSDSSKGTIWHHNPDIVGAIETNEYVSQFSHVEIDFYDSAIVGDWGEMNLTDSVGGNAGEIDSDDDVPWSGPAHGDEEGNASWNWTDPYHRSGSTNAVMSSTP